MSTFLTDIAKALNNGDKVKADKSFYGVIKEKITDGATVTGYKVSIGGDEDIVEARKMAGADVGDTVLCTLMSNGSVAVTGRKDGDKDAQDAQETADNTAQDLATNYSTTEETIELIGEYGGGSYQIVEYARSSSNTVAPTTGWSKTIPDLTDTYKYLWVRIVKVNAEGEEEIVQAPQLSTALSGIYTFISAVRHDATTIDGGSIYTGTITADEINMDSLQTNIARIGSVYSGRYVEITNNGIIIHTNNKTFSFLGDTYSGTIEYNGGESALTFNNGQLYTLYNLYVDSNDISIYNGDLDISMGNINVTAGNISTTGTVQGQNLVRTGTSTTSNQAVYITKDGELRPYTGSSSKRVKKNIKAMTDELHSSIKKLYDLPVKLWKYKNTHVDKDDEWYDKELFGVIAEELEEMLPMAVSHDADGNTENYHDRFLLNALLVLVQDQHKEIEELKERVSALENK